MNAQAYMHIIGRIIVEWQKWNVLQTLAKITESKKAWECMLPIHVKKKKSTWYMSRCERLKKCMKNQNLIKTVGVAHRSIR